MSDEKKTPEELTPEESREILTRIGEAIMTAPPVVRGAFVALTAIAPSPFSGFLGLPNRPHFKPEIREEAGDVVRKWLEQAFTAKLSTPA